MVKVIGFSGGGMEVFEKNADGTTRFKAKVVRAGTFNRLNITSELLGKNLGSWADVPGSYKHFIDAFDAGPIGVEHLSAGIENGWIVLEGQTLNTSAGRDMAVLLEKHKSSIAKGKKGILAPSIGFEIPEGQTKLQDDGTRTVMDWIPDHVAYGRRGHQAVPDADMIAFQNTDKLFPEPKVFEVKTETDGIGVLTTITIPEKEDKKLQRCKHVNEDGSFKDGYDGCVAHQMECEGHDEESAKKISAYIGRKAGK